VAVAGQIKLAVPLSIVLWDAELIAEYLRRSPQVVRERAVTLPGFPRPIRIPSVQAGKPDTVSKALPRWKAAEVIAWTASLREQPRGRPRRVRGWPEKARTTARHLPPMAATSAAR